MIFEMSFDDGHSFDWKVYELVKKYDLLQYTTFYIPSEKRELMDSEVWILAHESNVGGHSKTHPHDIKKCDDEELEREIIQDKKDIEKITEKPVTSFCYPRGRYNAGVKEYVKRAGYTEARTTHVLCTELSGDPFEKRTTIHMMKRKEYNGEDWYDLAVAYFNKALEKGDTGYFHIWGHSWEIDNNDDWFKFEKFLEIVKTKL